jgi:hypothetical protein
LGLPSRGLRSKLLVNHSGLFCPPWGPRLTIPKKQLCERFDGATPFLPPTSTSWTGSMARAAGAPRNSGKNNGLVATFPPTVLPESGSLAPRFSCIPLVGPDAGGRR